MEPKDTEADLEARLHEVLSSQLPMLPSKSIKHQTTFSIQLGHKSIDVDGLQISGRSDIVISYNNRHLAVIELKRSGTRIKQEDLKQGLSYARLLEPMAPLLIVSNGDETHTYLSYSGEKIDPLGPANSSIEKFFLSAAKLANEDLKSAVSILFGTDEKVWKKIVESATHNIVQERQDSLIEVSSESVSEIRVPRESTQEIIGHLRSNAQIVFLKGDPLSGKSTVIYELIDASKAADDFTVLLIDPAETSYGVFLYIANIISASIGTPIDESDVRTWLARLKDGNSTALVIALDGTPNGWCNSQIQELRRHFCGSGVRLVIAATPPEIETMTVRGDRKPSALANGSKLVLLNPYSDKEISSWRTMLASRGLTLLDGWHHAVEYRRPWIAKEVIHPFLRHAEPGRYIVAPAIPSIEILGTARRTFDEFPISEVYAELAGALLDQKNSSHGIGVRLLSSRAFLLDASLLKERLGPIEIDRIKRAGMIKFARGDAGKNFFVPVIPQLLASEVARSISRTFHRAVSQDSISATPGLIGACGGLPLDDIIGAQALVDAIVLGLPLAPISELLSIKPELASPEPGMRAAMLVGGRLTQLHWLDNGRVEASWHENGRTVKQQWDDDWSNTLKSDYLPWLMLSHLCSYRTAGEDEHGNIALLYPALLAEIGSCRSLLMRHEIDGSMINTHAFGPHGEFFCGTDVREPITQAMVYRIAEEPELIEYLLNEIAERKSAALASRLMIALHHIARSADANAREQASKANVKTAGLFEAIVKDIAPPVLPPSDDVPVG